LIGKIWTFLPIGTIPFRTNFLSLVAGLATLAIMVACALELISRISSKLSRSEKRFVVIIPALLLALSVPYWHNALITEVYTLNLLFLAVVLLFILRWERTGDHRLILTAGFVYGLTLGIHAPSILFAPAFLGFFLWNQPHSRFKRLGPVLFFVFLGLSTYLYLPIRSTSNPPFNWGNAKTLSGFWAQVSDEKDRSYHFAPVNKRETPTLLLKWVKMAGEELTPFVPLFSIFGIVALRRHVAFLFLTLAVIGMNLLFFLGWNKGTIFLPSYLVLGLLSSMGIASFVQSLRRLDRLPFRPIFLFGILGLGLIPFLIVKNLHRLDLSNVFLPREVTAANLYELEPGGTILTGLFWFHFRYHQDIERLRDDIGVLSAGHFNRAKYFGPPRDEELRGLRLPELPFPQEGEARQFLYKLISLNAGERPVYWPMDWELSAPFFDQLLPEIGFLFRALPREKKPSWPQIEQYLTGLESQLSSQIKSEGFFRDPEVAQWYLPFLPTLSYYLKHHGYPRQALSVATLTYNWFEQTAREIGFDRDLGTLHHINGNRSKAADFFRRHLELFPDDSLSSYNLGILLAEEGKHREALSHMTRAAKLDPKSVQIHQALSAIHNTLGNREAAQREFAQFLKLSKPNK
jgi:tetratricopeptide (TPR) repeat protein